jgi:hypothetical protein
MAKLLSGTTIYGTANAMFVGVSGNNYVVIQGANTGNVGIFAAGSETNVPLVIAPKGSGAIQANFNDNTILGGIARGVNAVDLQTSRTANTSVAAGYYNVILGGVNNSGTSNLPFTTLNSTIASNNTPIIYFTALNPNVKYGQIVVATGISSNTSNNFISFATFTVATGTTASATTGFIGNGANTANGNIFTANNVTGNLIPGMVLTGANILGLPPGTSNTYIVSNNTVTFTSTISGNVLTVATPSANVTPGMRLYNGTITPSNTYITAQNTGTGAPIATATFTAASGSTNITLSAFTLGTISSVAVGQFVNAISGIISTNTFVTSVTTANSAISINIPLLSAIAQPISLRSSGGAGTYDLNQIATGTPTVGTSYTVNNSQFVAPNLITGTPYTLTLAGNQSVPANTTFSFFTPHGVVVGGGNNQANGAYSFVGGGGDGGNSANGNKATGDYSVIVSGVANRATGIASFVGSGGVTTNSVSPNQATANYAVIVGGYGNVASASGSFIGGGRGQVASGQNFTVTVGGDSNQTTNYYGITVGGQSNINNSQYGFIGGGQANSSNNHNSFVGTGYNNSSGSTQASTLLISTTIAVTSSSTLYLQQAYPTIRTGMYFSGFVGSGITYSYVTQPVTTSTPAVMAGSTISGTTLTVGSVSSGTIVPGMMVTGAGIVGVCYIVSGAGLSWTINATQTVGSPTTLTGTLYSVTVSPAMSATAGAFIYVTTAYATVVNGGNNVANGSYSFIGSGGDAGNANNRNISSGDWSVVVGGIKNTANGIGSFVGGGGYHVGGNINGNFAGGSSSAIVGGFGNSTAINTQEAFIGAGYQNQIIGGTQSAIVSGAIGTITSAYSFIGSGTNNTVGGIRSSVVGGFYNNAAGTYNFIGGGYNNSGTPSTQFSATTTIANTSTIVYISTLNTSIRVGQQMGGYSGQGTALDSPYVTSVVTANGLSLGTGATIASNTLTVGTGSQVGTANLVGYTLSGPTYTGNVYVISYVSGSGDGSTWTTNTTTASAATSANSYSFTLSNTTSVLAGASLNFATPHGIVVGGGNNQANGAYSFIGGGGDAGTPSNRNLVAQDFSSIVGGRGNQIQANATGAGLHFIGGGESNIISNANAHAFIGSGQANIISASRSVIGGGSQNQASGINSVIGGGTFNLVNSTLSAIIGGAYGTTRGISGNHVFPACVNPIATSQGVSQASLLVLARQTTDATPTVLASDANAISAGGNQVILPNNSAYFFRGEVIAGVTGGGNTKGWTIEGVIKRGVGVGTTALVGTPTVTSSFADAGASTWTIAVTADTTYGGLSVTFTGQAGTTIRCVAQIRTTEMTF